MTFLFTELSAVDGIGVLLITTLLHYRFSA